MLSRKFEEKNACFFDFLGLVRLNKNQKPKTKNQKRKNTDPCEL